MTAQHGARLVVRVAVTVAVVAALGWMCVEAAPGTTAERAARAAGALPSDDSTVPAEVRAEIIRTVSQSHDLGGSAVLRVASVAARALIFDFGQSWQRPQTVRELVIEAAPPTLILILATLLFAVALGALMAFLSVVRGGFVAGLVAAVSSVIFAVPPVWLGIVALSTLAFGHPWTFAPIGGLDGPTSLVLPVLVLSLVPAAVIARHGRAALLAAATSPWATAALARGISRRRLLVVHAGRVAAAEILPLATSLTGYLVGAALVIERLFAIPGMGWLMVDAADRGDGPVVVGISTLVALAVAAVSAAVEAVLPRLDPRLDGEGGDA